MPTQPGAPREGGEGHVFFSGSGGRFAVQIAEVSSCGSVPPVEHPAGFLGGPMPMPHVKKRNWKHSTLLCDTELPVEPTGCGTASPPDASGVSGGRDPATGTAASASGHSDCQWKGTRCQLQTIGPLHRWHTTGSGCHDSDPRQRRQADCRLGPGVLSTPPAASYNRTQLTGTFPKSHDHPQPDSEARGNVKLNHGPGNVSAPAVPGRWGALSIAGGTGSVVRISDCSLNLKPRRLTPQGQLGRRRAILAVVQVALTALAVAWTLPTVASQCVGWSGARTVAAVNPNSAVLVYANSRSE